MNLTCSVYVPGYKRVDSNGRVTIDVEPNLLGKAGGAYVAVSKLFEYPPKGNGSGLHGATHYSAYPVTQEELDRRIEEARDPEHSPYAYLWEEAAAGGHTDKGLAEWLRWFLNDHDARDIVLDPSGGGHLWEHQERVEAECDLRMVATDFSSCGRLLTTVENLDHVYDYGLLAAVREAEECGLGRIEVVDPEEWDVHGDPDPLGATPDDRDYTATEVRP